MKSAINKNNRFASLLTCMLLLFCAQFIVAQTVRTVDNRPQSGAQYTTVAAAIAASIPGDIIYIHPSTSSYGNFTIDKTLTLIGSGHDPSNFGGIRSTIGTVTLAGTGNPDVSGTVFTGLNIGHITANSFGSQSDNIHIINNRITAGADGYFNGTGSDGWIIEGNYFDSAASSNNLNVNFCDNWNIRNNVFEGQIIELD
ncbi:MAG: hypothetical protein KJO77_00515, partial [Bacteroidia bacterium]|nr:hypothetical protein [Bacteroidia bacterium]